MKKPANDYLRANNMKAEKIVPKFYSLNELATSLFEKQSEIIDVSPHSIFSRWFHSQNDADVILWMDKNKNVLKQQICIYGQVVHWDIISGIKTGVIMDEETPDKEHEEDFEEIKAKQIIYDARPVKATIEDAKLLLNLMSLLDVSCKAELINNLISNPTASTVDPKEFLKKFGSLGPAKTKTSIVKKLKNLFK